MLKNHPFLFDPLSNYATNIRTIDDSQLQNKLSQVLNCKKIRQ